jgi:DNA modification methylase
VTRFEVRTGDCLAVMRTLDDSSVDSIVTDPPYELGFMGKSWDASGVAFRVEVWREALRVLKPGGHLLAFSGSRTYHRMAVAIEDAGFEIRDQIMWVYGSGFPKSLDVSKAIDAAAGAEREVVGKDRRTANASWLGTQDGSQSTWGIGEWSITAPATPAAKQWQGWGTALKPAHEPIVVARKPLIGTVAANVMAHGTGALNIDGCRVACDWLNESSVRQGHSKKTCSSNGVTGWNGGQMHAEPNSLGRWPANLIHDGSEEATAGLGDAARFFYSAKASKADRDEGLGHFPKSQGASLNGSASGELNHGGNPPEPRANVHPTVKPTDLMRYLVRLVTPPGGLVLDPFTGSGSTGKAAVLEGFRFLGIELSPEYTEIARARIRHAVGHVAPEPVTEAQVPDALPGQLRLFA